jgi:cell wall-associated NlpC family hydrolase
MEGFTQVFVTKQFIRKVISVSTCSVIVLTALGFGEAGKAEAAVKKEDKIISTGKQYLGVKYSFGAAAGNTYAFDCSSFTQYIFKKNGVTLPRTSSAQSTKGVKVAKTSMKKGDLVFFKDPGRPGKIGHVAVYMGNNKMIGASGNAVKISTLKSSYWKKNFVMARRVI